LTGDTKVYDLHSKKIVRIEDLIYRKKINTFAFNTNKIVGMKATKAWSTGVKPVFKITLINGLSINATANHKFLTPDGWFSCDTLNAKSIAIPVSYEFPKPIDPEDSEVRLLGHFISNGSCVKGQPIRYTCNTDDYDLAEIVASDAKISTGNKVDPKIKRQEVANRSKWLNVFFKPTFHITHGKTSPIADIMRRYGLFNVRSKDKFIPDEVFFWSNKSACLFLSALFTGDGNIFFSDKNGRKSLKISYSTASEKLSVDIQNLLAKCGIVSFKTKLQNKKGQSWYVIYIAGKSNIKMFVEKIGFISSRKNKKLIEAWELVKDRLAGWNKYEFNEDRTLCFMPVKSIELIGDVEVYDMEVPIAHNFIANGIIAHNSIEQDADMVCFTYRPEYYYRQNVGGFSQVITIDGGSVVSGQIPIEGYAEIIVAKQRNGNTGTSQVGFIPKYTQFVNYESI
jgi:replicative DNA helicase